CIALIGLHIRNRFGVAGVHGFASMHGLAILARRAAFAHLAAAAAPAPPALAAMAVGTAFAFARFAGGLLAAPSLGFFRLDFGFVIQIERRSEERRVGEAV